MFSRRLFNSISRTIRAVEPVYGQTIRAYSADATTGTGKPTKGPLTQRIEEKLTKAFSPTILQVINDSYPNESHFRILVVSEAFEGQTLPRRHRQVYAEISDELRAGIHAIQVFTKTPKEAESS